MFTTFQTGNAAGSGDAGDSKSNRGSSRRITTPVACVECRRRKIRCDGLLPCGQCQWYQHPESCSYAKPVQRMMPSRKLVEKLNSSIEQHQIILNRLFGTKDIDSLVSLPREELLNLALSKPVASPSTSLSSTGIPAVRAQDDGISPLETLEEAPDNNDRIFGEKFVSNAIHDIQDEFSNVSLRLNNSTTYVGISSVNAALKVIFRLVPSAKAAISTHEPLSLIKTDEVKALVEQDQYALPDNDTAEALITAYFERVHPFFPMVDEKAVWRHYTSGTRKDDSWMALLNMIFALGSVSLRNSDNNDHVVFFTRSCNFLGIRLDICRVATLESLQALIMIAGYYLYYMHRPNEGDSAMGACSRIACQLGLHREFPIHPEQEASIQDSIMESSPEKEIINFLDENPAEIRRRTWWSFYCLDTLVSINSGRPSFGRNTSGVSVREPVPTPNLDPQDPRNLKLLPLIHSIAFCKIATLIQDKLCSTPLIQFDEVMQLDANLVRWWEELPPILTKEPERNIPSYLRVPRLVMKWRYQNLRVLLHRPYLLSTALRKIPFENLSSEEKVAVGNCRIVAAKTIEDISQECKTNVISAWNGVWMAYQAAFIPLISLFTDFFSMEERDKWRSQVKAVLSFFLRIQKYYIGAHISHQVISKLLDAAKAAADTADAHRRQKEALMIVISQREQQLQHEKSNPHASPLHRQSYLPSQPSTVPLSVLTTMAPPQSDLLHGSPHSSPTPSYAQTFGPSMSSLGGGMTGPISRSVPQTPTPHYQHSPSLTGMVPSPVTLSSQHRFAHGHSMSQPIGNVGNVTSHHQAPTFHHHHFHHQQNLGGSPLQMAHSPASVGDQVFWDDMMWDNFSKTELTQQQAAAQQMQQHISHAELSHPEVYGQSQPARSTGGETWPNVQDQGHNWSEFGGS